GQYGEVVRQGDGRNLQILCPDPQFERQQLLEMILAGAVVGNPGKLQEQSDARDEQSVIAYARGPARRPRQGGQTTAHDLFDRDRADSHSIGRLSGVALQHGRVAVVEQRQVVGVPEELEHACSSASYSRSVRSRSSRRKRSNSSR